MAKKHAATMLTPVMTHTKYAFKVPIKFKRASTFGGTFETNNRIKDASRSNEQIAIIIMISVYRSQRCLGGVC